MDKVKYASISAVSIALLGAVVPLLTAGKLYEGIVAGVLGLAVLAVKAKLYK